MRFPVWGGRSGFAVEEFARRHGDFAIAGATVAVELDDDDRVARCGIGLLGLGSTPLRGSAAEDAVVGQPADAVTGDEVGALAMVARAWAAAVRQAQASEREAIHA